jgi:glycosyltransferase involved in cell wall biosynthesis
MNISIAMCTYNGARYLQQQLDSIALQTVAPGELIICDDGSTDSTLHIVGDFAKTAPFPVRLHKNSRNLGYSKNFEEAIGRCSGDLIALSDQDDLWHPQKLATLSSLLQPESPAGGAFSDGDVMREGTLANVSIWQSIGFGVEEQAKFRSGRAADVLLRGNVVTGMTLMFKADLRAKLLPIPGNWVHDSWLAWILVLSSVLIPCTERLVVYRAHESQQIGPPQSLGDKIRWTLRRGIRTFLDETRSRNLLQNQRLAQQFEELSEFLMAQDGTPDELLLRMVRAKAEHAHARSAILSQSRQMRLPRIWRHAEGYRRYSRNPARSMILDLVV